MKSSPISYLKNPAVTATEDNPKTDTCNNKDEKISNLAKVTIGAEDAKTMKQPKSDYKKMCLATIKEDDKPPEFAPRNAEYYKEMCFAAIARNDIP